MTRPRCRDCGASFEQHKGILEVCPDQKGRKTFETHYRPQRVCGACGCEIDEDGCGCNPVGA